MPYTYDYPRPALTADVMVIDTHERLLLIRRGHAPFEGCWALPGGFMEMDETLPCCAQRELQEETGLCVDEHQLRLVGVFSRVDRDPRGRTVSVVYACRLPEGAVASAGDDAAEARWWPIDALPPLAFDHDEVVAAYRSQSLGLR